MQNDIFERNASTCAAVTTDSEKSFTLHFAWGEVSLMLKLNENPQDSNMFLMGSSFCALINFILSKKAVALYFFNRGTQFFSNHYYSILGNANHVCFCNQI